MIIIYNHSADDLYLKNTIQANLALAKSVNCACKVQSLGTLQTEAYRYNIKTYIAQATANT
jgi:hypothetical protein